MEISKLKMPVNISKSPITGLNRVVDINSFNWIISDDKIILDTVCYNIKDEKLFTSKEVNEFVVKLVADNSTMVDPKTGAIVDPDENGNYPDGLMGQYDFMKMLSKIPVLMEEMLINYVLIADSRGRYND